MISVCLATYNGEKYLREQIDSILQQLDKDDELVVSDDGSIDSTLKILNSYKDKRITLYNNTDPHGVNANFNNALSHAQGDYIFLADQDDIWIDGKVKACLKALETSDCVMHNATLVNGECNIIEESLFNLQKCGKGFWKNVYRNTYSGCCMAFRRELLEVVLPIPTTRAFHHDEWIGSIADVKYRVTFIPYSGILFRRHGHNTSSTANKSNYSIIQQLTNRIIKLIQVCIRVNFNFHKKNCRYS